MKRVVKLRDCVKEYDTKDVFCVLNVDEAEAYVGQVGYFADNLDEFDDALKYVDQGYWCKKLERIFVDRYDDRCFIREDSFFSRYFLPAEKVKVKAKDEA